MLAQNFCFCWLFIFQILLSIAFKSTCFYDYNEIILFLLMRFQIIIKKYFKQITKPKNSSLFCNFCHFLSKFKTIYITNQIYKATCNNYN